ncbi:hypothetical protein Moror_17134 [Moniliophthora roreri MCA 2997]|uniref:Uncharacterized protein n=1 Tax=Moniliophthora roreri (strain MCA 2997) TaxID=1381753 RepID=V2X8K6_MONRO|nr:hypothetical protein Moror_17134 [Moniliophthora roreri MCA 2997]KAI3604339.1 hypothetical protein WG66_008580 [Moniliophthora roreri]
MPDNVPVVSICLANVAVESLLYGIFFVLNIGSIVLICFPLSDVTKKESISRRVQMAVKKPMFLGAIALFVSITGHWICTVLRLFGAVVFSEKGPSAYYEDLSENLYAIKTGFIEASLIIGDSMLIYRLWMVWSRNYYVIVIPILTLTGLIALIGYRIWWTERQSRYSGATRVGRSNLSSVLAIFIESALLYTSWTVAFIATYAAESRVESVIADCWAAMAGISFGLINVRIGLGWARNPSAMLSTIPGRQQHRGAANTGETSLAYPMQPLAIHVHQVKDTSPTDRISFSGVDGPDSSTQKNERRGDSISDHV